MKKLFLCLMMLTFTFGVGMADDLYILGLVNGNGSQPNQAVKMTFDDKNDIYTADIWVIGNSDNPMGVPGTWFAFTTVVANDNDNGGWGYVNDNRYSPSPDNGNYYWLNNGTVSNVPLTKQNNDKAFLIPSGLYKISVAGDLSSFSLDEVKDLAPTITPEGGDVPMGALVNVTLSENFNTFISECNPVVNSSGSTINITPPEVKFFVNDIQISKYVIDYGMNLYDLGEITITGKCTLVAGNTEYITKTASETYNVYPIFNATIPANTSTGGIVSFSSTDIFNTSLNNLVEDQIINVYVTPCNNREIATLTYIPEEGYTVDLLKGSYNEEEGCYSFNMPAANVTVNATFVYNGPEPTESMYELVTSKTDNPFEVGAKYLIVNEDAKKALGIPVNSALAVAIDKEHKVTISSDSDVAQFVLGGSDKDGWTFQSEYGYLKFESTINEISQNGTADDTWAISFDDYNNAYIISNGAPDYQICYKSKGIFSAMTSGGKDYYVQLFKEIVTNVNVTVSGTVTDKETEEGIEGVAVTLVVNTPAKADVISYTATTDADGVYSMDITPVEGATYDMTFEKDGYVSQTVENVDINKAQDVALELEALNTGISNINTDNVVSVKYVNSMGHTSSKPFDGINIVVTRYTDGTTSTTKIVR
ncbi:MAG: carboxypeptidase regulatory-like domain-containing protein [Muribaculaceae bacterium]|nr:carboxypeptidase regulatory-like domain-containing protein [Muribaculaceae bacterium]